ncbi:signal peptidase I [Clostridium sp. LBM24168]
MENKGSFKKFTEYAFPIILAIGLAFICRSYVFARTDVIGPSMQPTFSDKDIVFMEKISTETGHINRGEIVVFNSHDENEDNYIKRVIGIPGDKIEIMSGKVYLNGKILAENYLPEGVITESNSAVTKYVVPEGYIFVLGDNRQNSTDSRIIGPVNLKDVKGHVILRVYPFDNINYFK